MRRWGYSWSSTTNAYNKCLLYQCSNQLAENSEVESSSLGRKSFQGSLSLDNHCFHKQMNALDTFSMPSFPLFCIFWPRLVFDGKCQVNWIFSSISVGYFEGNRWAMTCYAGNWTKNKNDIVMCINNLFKGY